MKTLNTIIIRLALLLVLLPSVAMGADNFAVTEGSGTTMGADEVTRNAISEKQQVIKLSLGTEGSHDALLSEDDPMPVEMQSESLYDEEDSRTILYDDIDITATGPTAIISNTDAGLKIKVLQYVVICDAATTLTFEEETSGTNLSGAMAIAANGGVSANCAPYGCFKTGTADRDVMILLGTAVNCDGHVTYVELD